MHRLLRLLLTMSTWERWTLLALTILFVGSFAGLLRVFYVENTVIMPATGGTYIEGSVGDLQPLNPWFIVQNDVNRDIVSLVFSGLLRYNPQTRRIEDDLALLQVSPDSKTYTVRLKDNVFWHDSTEKDPHPVTADDVVFTFSTLQDPAFPNMLLQQNFRGVRIEKMDERTVKFLLDEPYSFFASNLTLGLLPKASFEGVPIAKLDLTSDFGYKPVGAGPYKLKTITQTELSTEITLERFRRDIPPSYRLDRIVFRIFPDYSSLLSDLRNLQGVRLVAKDDRGQPIIPRRYVARQYTLPQYVALFFNLDRGSLQDRNLRLGLQLGTDKLALAEHIHESVLVDTPLLELDMGDWRYHFDPAAAQGALFESNWNMPEKIRLQRLLEEEDVNRQGVLHAPSVVNLGTGAVLTLSGSMAELPPGSIRINSQPIHPHPTASGAWITVIPTLRSGTGALKLGLNVIRLTDAKGKTLDSVYVYRARSEAEYARARAEQDVLKAFLATRAGTAPEGGKMTIQEMVLDKEMLRRRKPSDDVSVRRNDSGEQLALHLLTSPSPAEYRKVAEFLQRSWADLGVKVTLDIPKTREEFQDKLLKREYDLLLFGQSLLDNLDSYSYWHSSGVQKSTGDPKDLRQDAYNLSQYASFQADTLLERVRRTRDEKERNTALTELRRVLSEDVPAVFLYSPRYSFAQHRNILGVELGSLSLHSDRFLTLHKWYVRQERVFKPGTGWFSFFTWVPSLFTHSAAAK
ncbi:MAG: ABC transporter substrate-binding protein [Candidatus Peribacteraceae bacterium]